MRTVRIILAAGVLVTLATVAVEAVAQQVTIATPYRNLNSSFFEQNSVNWSGNWRGITFSMGGGALAKPQFGSPDPTAGLSTNFGFAGPEGRINFALNFAQGAKQSATSQTPSVTIMNGQTGNFSDTSLTPFVISVVPVVGAMPIMPQQQMANFSGPPWMQGNSRVQEMLQNQGGDPAPRRVPPAPQPNPPGPAQDLKMMNVPDPVPAVVEKAQQLGAAQESSAGRPAPSVAEARRMHQQEQGGGSGEELQAHMERARALEEDGKPNVAKIYYERVARHADGELKQQALERLDAIRGTANR